MFLAEPPSWSLICPMWDCPESVSKDPLWAMMSNAAPPIMVMRLAWVEVGGVRREERAKAI